MQQLEQLTRQARQLAQGDTPEPTRLNAEESEASRILQICNACRYCEGFCAVFPAMTRRLEFSAADVHYLANLCHNCGACLHACQYAEPHDFAVNVPRTMGQVRAKTYQAYAWPASFGRLYHRNGLTVAVALVLAVSGFLIAALAMEGTLWKRVDGGNFYAIFPHGLMVNLFGPVFLWAMLSLFIGVSRFWRESRPHLGDHEPAPVTTDARIEAARDVLALTYLDGGHGEGCHDTDDRATLWRRRFHHATFYGFMLCVAATSLATVYHYVFGWVAPYPLLSGPVILGTVGGVGIVIGPIGLLLLNLRRHPLHADVSQHGMDRAFILLLALCGVTGLALLGLRETAAMPLMLAVHLGAVMAFFLTMPYSKFAHGFFRSSALLKNAIEKRLPSRLRLGPD